MKAGTLRTLLTFEGRTDTTDGMGGVTVAWSTVAQAYGRQLFRDREWRAAENITANQTSSVQRSRWEARYTTGISPAMRMKTPEGRVFEIESVYDPSGKGERIEIVAKELQNPGV